MLPITQFLPHVSDLLSTHHNVVLQAEPGAGKSTALPLSLIDAEWLGDQKIVMLEPRRIAAKSIAHYLARQLGESVGQRVGYQVKNDRKVSVQTRLEIVTEGILTRRMQNDPELSDIGLIIFDEAHERSIHTDLALMLALEVQQTIREDMKLLVMSATIDTDLIASYLGGASVIKCPGRAYPVRVEYRSTDSSRASNTPLSSTVITALKSVLEPNQQGDILVFLPGQADIKKCLIKAETEFKHLSDVLFLPLYGSLPINQQEQALMPDPTGKRRVVFTTNIAETSLTIEGVTTVIDSGLEKVSLFDPSSGMSRLDTRHISKASAEQRKGRAGRVKPGNCIRLWSESRQQSLQDYQGEEILTADLGNLTLDLMVWGLSDFEAINWLTPPPAAHFESARQLLISLGIMCDTGKITPLGANASNLGITPRLSAMLLQSKGSLQQEIACELAALLSEGDVFYNRRGVDITERLIAIQDYKTHKKNALNTWPLKTSTVEHVLKASKSLKNSLNISTKLRVFTLVELQEQLGKLLITAYPDRLAKQRSANEGRYQLANGKGVLLFDDDSLFGSEWMVVSDCNAQKREGQIFSAAAISLDDIFECVGHLIHEDEQYQLDDKKQRIVGKRRTTYGAIALKTQPLASIPADEFQACLKSLLTTEGLTILNWTPKCEDWLQRAEWLGGVMKNFPRVSKVSFIENIDQWLLPYISNVTSLAQLKRANIYELIVSSLTWDQQQLLDQEAPLTYVTPSDKKIPIVYDKNQGPTVSVRLQEMFGEVESPRIGGNQVPLRFELLSPAQRPIQTTSDLANFWLTSYFDVAKDMRGRYPRHRWPEQPLLEKAGHSIKHKRR